MSKNSDAGGGGSIFTTLLSILFITLKLLGITQVASWSWWWVLSPIWISALLAIVIIGSVYLYIKIFK